MTSNSRRAWVALVPLLSVLGGCTPVASTPPPVDANNHRFFPIGPGTGHALGSTTVEGEVTCESCHRMTAGSLADVHCDACHKHPDALIPQLHLGVPDAGFPIDVSTLTDPIEQSEKRSAQCASCHPTGTRQFFSHTGITDTCEQCHAPTTSFAALPKPGFTHSPPNPVTCFGCHKDVTSWANVSGNGSLDVADPSRSLLITGLVPAFSGTSIARVSPLDQTLPMKMVHASPDIDAGVLADCGVCHLVSGSYFPGVLHSSLAEIGEPQPRQCAGCHTETRPLGFVGPTVTTRAPPTGPMRHDAELWMNGTPGTTAALTADCASCHRPPGRTSSSWSNGDGDGGVVRFHVSLTAQPGSCLGCHANTRPQTPLTSANATLPVGMTFDHQLTEALGDCQSCHGSTSTWVGGTFHAGQPTPTTCLPCHAMERPTSTTGWRSTTYTRSPFDYGTNAQGITHGGGEDCAVCHATSTSTWVGGHFPHGAGTLAATTCSACHTTQRPAQVVQSFDHSLNGTGECRACHQATVVAGRYVDYFNPTTMTLPGGDWQGGTSYPGDILVTSPTQFLNLNAIRLTRNAQNFVTGQATQQLTIFNAMLHTSSVLPAALNAGPSGSPNNATCWHCHTNTNGTVTLFRDGKYHDALTTYSATPGGAVTPFPQPTNQCADCHAQMRPQFLVQRMGNVLFSMDHGATFTQPTLIDGRTVSGVAGLDCSSCHSDPGGVWSDGRFHSNIATATPADCVSCHYPLSATTTADVSTPATPPVTFDMKHRAPQLTLQRCDTCHTTALTRAAMQPTVATLWQTGRLHPSVPSQPATCVDCHQRSEPLATSFTRSTTTWTFAQGGTATNGAQYMNHSVAEVQTRDCATCHAADAKTLGSAWSRDTKLHSRVTVTSCRTCHGLQTATGVPGTNNNYPAGLTNSRTVTTTATAPANTPDQISHADVNVTGRDCNFCHTAPTATVADWKLASFHTKFTGANTLVMNLTTGRCSNCHLNVKPGAAFTAFDHAMYTATSGSPDCSSCHSWPGEGNNPASPNWRGAAAMPQFITVGGFTIPQPPASAPNTVQVGINNLPHPTPNGQMCSACHQATTYRRALGYDHLSSLAATRCSACHEAGSDLVGTVWNNATTEAAGLGDTRPFTLPSVRATYKGNTTTENYPRHFFPIDCKECHVIPAGNGLTTTGAAYQTAWRFPHTTRAMANPSTCLTCHPGGAPD